MASLSATACQLRSPTSATAVLSNSSSSRVQRGTVLPCRLRRGTLAGFSSEPAPASPPSMTAVAVVSITATAVFGTAVASMATSTAAMAGGSSEGATCGSSAGTSVATGSGAAGAASTCAAAGTGSSRGSTGSSSATTSMSQVGQYWGAPVRGRCAGVLRPRRAGGPCFT